MTGQNEPFDPHLDDHSDDKPDTAPLASSTPEVKEGWDNFQRRLAAGDVEYLEEGQP